MRRPSNAAAIALAFATVLAATARADEGQDGLALARKTVEAHRSDAHRDRFEVAYPEPRPAPRRGSARVEARSGRYVLEDTGLTLTLEGGEARLVRVSRAHVPIFAARAAGKRDEARLLEARVPAARARTALVALAVLATAQLVPKGAAGAEEDPSEEAGTKLVLDLDGRLGERTGPFADLGRTLLEELGKESGLGPPLDADAALRRLASDLSRGEPAASRAAFVLGDAGFLAALPALAALEGEDARDARAKIAALADKAPRERLLELSTGSGSWDVRAWARERLELDPKGRADWIAAALAPKTPEDALVEALRAASPVPRETGEALLDDPRPAVRVEAAGALLRAKLATERARDVLLAVVDDPRVAGDARENAIARLASALSPAELAAALGPLLGARAVPASVRAQAARALDQAEASGAAAALAAALEVELGRAPPRDSGSGAEDPAARDLRIALVAALATLASKAAGADADSAEPAFHALVEAAAGDPDDEIRALAIHGVASLPGKSGEQAARAALAAERSRKQPSEQAQRAAEIEVEARGGDLRSIADAVCDAPLRGTFERLVRAAREPGAKATLVEELKARGPAGEAGLEAIAHRVP
jgi:hypothetical protein